MDRAADREPIEARFALGERVASGAYGEVLRAHDRVTEQPVAVKRMHEHVLDPAVLQRFETEARLLAGVASPYVVRYVAHGPDARGRPCLVLEWLEGEDLARRVARAPLALGEALAVAVQVAQGLSALHAAGIVHRDVKPANIVLRPGDGGAPRATLVDLGVARAEAEPRLTFDGMLVGSPAYMSPEQARGDAALDGRSDQFALAVVLYELLAGERPFAGGDRHAVLAKLVLAAHPPLAPRAPRAPREVVAAIDRALAKDPAARFASMAGFAAALGAALSDADEATTTAARAGPFDAGAPASATLVEPAEPRVVTAVFAAFADPAAGLPPFARCAAAHEGRVHGTLGGRAIAVFGQAHSAGDEHLRAARTALAARAEVPGVRLAVVTCRVLGRGGALAADAIERGAAQLLAGAAGAVSLDDATARLLAPHFDVLDGAAGAEPARLLGARPSGAEPVPRLCGRATPTVGRARELAQLDALLAECREESVARVALVTAAAGVGKSRLRREWLGRVGGGSGEVAVLAGHGDPIRAGAPFALLGSAVRAWAGVPDAAPPAARWKALRAAAARLAPPSRDAEQLAEFLGELAGAPRPGPGSAALAAARDDARAMGEQLRRAFEAWLAALCAGHAAVALVLDDVHWGDEPSVQLVDAALRVLADRPLAVVAFARPEVHERFPELWAARARTELRLAPLSPRQAEQLARAALGGADAPAATVARVAALSGGNAFFLEELVRAVVAPARRDDDDDDAAAAAALDALPATVLAMAQARLDALPPAARRLVRRASVFGAPFGAAALAALADEPAADAARVEPELARLVDAEVLDRRGAPGESRAETAYTFRHELLREAAYALAADAERAEAHGRAGEWLARSGRAEAAVLAAHFDRAGDSASAAHWHERAAAAALARCDLRAVGTHVARALACGAAGVAVGRLRHLEAVALQWRGEWDPAERAAREAMAHLPPGDAAWFGAVLVAGSTYNTHGRHAAVMDLVREAAPVVPAPDAREAAFAWRSYATIALIHAGETAVARAMAGALEAEARAWQGPSLVVAERLETLRANVALHLDGELEGFLRSTHAAGAAAAQVGNLQRREMHRLNVALGQWRLGDLTGVLAQSEAICADALLLELTSLANRARLLATMARAALARDAATARALLAGVLEEMAAAVELDRRGVAMMCAQAAELLVYAGAAEQSERESRRVIAIGATAPTAVPAGHATLALARLATGHAREALGHAEHALALGAALDQVVDGEAVARLAAAEAHRALGGQDAARAAIAEARARLHARAARIHDPALRASFLRGLPSHARTVALARAWLEGDAASDPGPLVPGGAG